MGQCPITPFNLEEEMESGSFDRAGNYRPRGTPLRPDPWLEALPWVRDGGGYGVIGSCRRGGGPNFGAPPPKYRTPPGGFRRGLVGVQHMEGP